MWLADMFLPARADRFISLLQRHADILCRVARAFNGYVATGTPSLPDEIDRLEKEGDQMLVDLTTALRDAFVTPIDRQDIYGLAEGIDDMIDYLNNAAREIQLFGVSATDSMREMAQMLEHAADAIAAAVRSLKTNPQAAWAHALEAQHAENLVEDRYRKALAELFNGSNVSEIFKLREIYRHLSNSADRADSIGRLIGKIVVKTS
jgi:uncharacterized protein